LSGSGTEQKKQRLQVPIFGPLGFEPNALACATHR
jgi:hypothetical protein